MKRFKLLFLLLVFSKCWLFAGTPVETTLDTLIAGVESITAVSCHGGADGAVTLNVETDMPPVAFLWSTGDTTQNVSGLAAGTYSVSVSAGVDLNIIIDDIVVTGPDEISLSVVSEVSPGCAGQLGSVTVEATGGTAGYDYAWNAGVEGASLFDVPAGTYEVIVTDANGCTAAFEVTLESAFPTAAITGSGTISCSTASVVLDGSSSSFGDNFIYEWSASVGGHFATATDTLVVEVDAAGTYYLEVTDTLNGCVSIDSIVIGEDFTAPLADAGDDVNAPCTNSEVVLEGTGSLGIQFSYNWTALDGGHIADGEDAPTATVDQAGTYVLTVSNFINGCETSDTVVVTGDNEPPFFTLAAGTLTCTVTSVQIVAVVDTTNLEYHWEGPAFTSTETSPEVGETGIYLFFAMDTITGCSNQDTISVLENTTSPTIVVTGGTLTCAVDSITLTVESSVSHVTYSWTSTEGFASDLQNPVVYETGSYVVVVTDTLNGCPVIDAAVVGVDTLAPFADAGADLLLNCFDPSEFLDGSASSQGDEFSYAWTTLDGNIVAGADSLFAEVDAAGTYTLTVTSATNGCSATADVTVTTDFEAPIVSATGGEINCYEPVIQLVSVFDTTDVSWEWTGPNGFVSNEINPFVADGGDYDLVVTDTLNGCSTTVTVTVTADQTPPTVTLTAGNLNCSILTVSLTASSPTADLLYSWSGANGFSSTQQDTVTSIPGLYYLLAIDPLNGCIALDSIEVGIDTLAPFSVAGPSFTLNCLITSVLLDGSASSTGADFSYLWTTVDGNIVEGETTNSPLVNAAGTYTLTVTNILNGCTSTSETTVVETSALTLTTTTDSVTCFGTARGAASVSVEGGTGVFTYAWSNGSLTDTASDLVAGTYNVSVFDADGCSATASVTIDQPAALAVNGVITHESAPGANDGSIETAPTGGTAPYSFAWISGDTTQNIIDLAPGFYPLTLSDDQGCAIIEIFNVNAFPCLLNGSIVGTNVTCNGNTDGSANVAVDLSVGPVQYLWSNGDTLATTDSLGAGFYNVNVSDSIGCALVLGIEITEPPLLVVSELFHEDVQCPADETGTSTVAVTGGVQPYTYLWSNGTTEATATGLSAGVYDVVVTDANGCEQVLDVLIAPQDNEPPVVVLEESVIIALNANGQATLNSSMLDAGSYDNCSIGEWTLSAQIFNCDQLGDHIITVTLSDMTGNVTIGLTTVTVIDTIAPVLVCPADVNISDCNPIVEFDLPTITDNCALDSALLVFDGLASGSAFPLGISTQVFTYTDASGNEGTCSFTVTVVEAPVATATSQNVTCAGLCNGSVALDVTGGVAPLSYVWSNGSVEAGLTGLCPGDYQVVITDASGCTATAAVAITEPDTLTITVLNAINPVCANDSTGVISLVVSGGTAPYTFVWSNGDNDGFLTNLGAGTYTLSLTDANGCSETSTTILVSQDTIVPVLAVADITASLNANGALTVTPDMLVITSSDNCGIASTTVFPNAFTCDDIGTQTVTVTTTDNSGLQTTATATVTIVDNVAPTITCPANITVGFCASVVNYSTPQLSDNCAINLANLQQLSGLASGATFPIGATVQNFTYVDASGNAATCSFTVTVVGAATITPTAVNAGCFGECDGTVTLNIAGGNSPFTIVWSNGQTGLVANNLCAGVYSASITDASGCLQTVTTTITQPSALGIAVGQIQNDQNGTGVGSIQVSVAGGTGPYSYSWTKGGQNFATTEDLANLNFGQYVLTVTDANGCTLATNVITVENTTATTEAAWANDLQLQPNPAADWTILKMDTPLDKALDIQIFDLTGKLVLTQNVQAQATEARLDLAHFPSGVYNVQLRSDGQMAVKRLVVTK